MDPVTIAMIVGAVAPLVANGINDAINAGDTARAQELANKAAKKAGKLNSGWPRIGPAR